MGFRTTWRNTTGFSPYELVYGKSVVFPMEFEIKTLITALVVVTHSLVAIALGIG